MENFEWVMAEGPAPKRSTFSAGWRRRCSFTTGVRSRSATGYRTRPQFVHRVIRLPKCTGLLTPGTLAEPEISFRIVHVAVDGAGGAPVAAYREQTVEIALGPKGAFENG